MKKTLVGVWLVLACAVAWAVPTVQQVQAEVEQGRYAQAETMMREVVDAKPGSAKAHYLYAEILAHNGSFAKASEEAGKAKQLDPGIRFTQPEKFQSFEKLLEREQKVLQRSEATAPGATLPTAAASPPLHTPTGGIPSWVWLAGLGGVGYLLWRGFSRSQATPAPGGATAGPGTMPATGYAAAPIGGYGSGAGVMNPPVASPSGGLLKTGLAVAGGVAAGMLVDEMLHRRQGAGTDQLSGLQHGMFDAPPAYDDAASELERRSVDFGNGGDWDASSGDANPGGGSDDGGWD